MLQIIEFFLNLLAEQNPSKVSVANTFFMPHFLAKGYEKVKKWMKKDLFDKDFLLIPLHVNENHWALIVSPYFILSFILVNRNYPVFWAVFRFLECCSACLLA